MDEARLQEIREKAVGYALNLHHTAQYPEAAVLIGEAAIIEDYLLNGRTKEEPDEADTPR